MKITSKSILSPGRGGIRDPPNSLSTSLSRRLKNSGSIKGGASPAMFPTATRKRGAFENNPEPSSPKVTCIGQVRVRGKKKKQPKKLPTLSRTSTTHTSGEVSFRAKDHHALHGFCSKTQNVKESLNLGSKGGQSYSQSQDQDCLQAQRSWVHFPVTVCEALRAFGSEFSCLMPCRTGKEEKTVVSNDGDRQGGGSCGKLFTRWLVAVQDGDGGGQRDIELVVGDEQNEEDEDYYEDESVVRKTRRHVFEDLEIINGRIEGHVDEGRVSICVPPKNALLLMRCRSDPVKSEALCSRSWEPSGGGNEKDDEEEFIDCKNRIGKELEECEATGEVEQQEVMVLDQVQENVQRDEVFDNMQQDEANKVQVFDNVQLDEANKVQVFDNVQLDEANKVQVFDNGTQDEANKVRVFDNVQLDEADKVQVFDNVQQNEANKVQVFDNVQQEEADQELDNVQQDEAGQDQEHDNGQQYDVGQDQEFNNVLKDEVQEHDSVQRYEVSQDQEHEQMEVEEESFYLVSLFEEIMNQDYEIQEQDEAHEDEVAETGATMVAEFAEISETHEEVINEAQEHNTGILDNENEVKEKRGNEEVLPECLLMMMHEPKLSINISKETWVCSTDFIKRKSNKRKPPPLPPPIKSVVEDGLSVGTIATVNDGFPTVLPQPARSSCSLPMAPSMATVLEQKLASAVGYEPFVLTRCKSEPVKTAASKLLLFPESCVLENRKLEGLSRVTFGLGF